MNKVVIIGSGFSALAAYLKFKNYNPVIISANNKVPDLELSYRKKLKVNKLFSSNSISLGNLKFNLKKNTKIHDRLTLGGNTNIWGGFININLLPSNFINDLNNIGINFHKLDQKKNGYSSNEEGLRQLRDSKNRILNVSNFFKNSVKGFVDSIEFKKNYIKVNYFSEISRVVETIPASKLLIGISFPQLIDLFYRSNLFEKKVKLKLDEFKHSFNINIHSEIPNSNYVNNLIVKYDFIRALKHFFGYQKSLDNFPLQLPIYVDQNFFNSKRFLNLNIDTESKIISQTSISKFGDSAHYCNLHIDEQNISKYLNNFSKNIFGISMPFVNQEKSGPISNDIVNNIYNIL